MDRDLWRWGAVELADAIRNGTVTARAAVESSLARINAVNPAINAIVASRPEEALALADEADDAVRRGDALGPLHGVPVTTKINADQESYATDGGVRATKDKIAPADSPAIGNWKKAGSIVVGRTNVPAFSWRWFTDNELHGRTLNPWDAGVTPGGSSGGASAALAVGMGALAHGNDQGGSIRHPAYACGLVGIRPSFGRVPAFNPSLPLDRPSFAQFSSTQGPLARSIADLRVALETMSAHDPRDPWWAPAPLSFPDDEKPCRVALFTTPPAGIEADPVVIGALHQAADWLREAGYAVEEAAPPAFEEAGQLWLDLLINEAREVGLLASIDKVGEESILRAVAGKKAAVSVTYDLKSYVQALARRTTLVRMWQLFLAEYPLLLMPVSWQKPFPAGLDQEGDERWRWLLKVQTPLIATAAVGVPGLAVPTGLADGLPMGVQLVADRFREGRCFAAGAVIEARAGCLTPIDPRF